MSTPLSTPIPLLNTGVKRIIIELQPTPVLHQYAVQVVKQGLEDQGWDFVHSMMSQALHQVAQTWVQQMLRGLMIPGNGVPQ